MIKKLLNINTDNLDLDFLIDEDIPKTFPTKKPYKVIISDDDDDVHSSTKLILKNFVFDGHGLELYSAYSGQQTIDLLKEHPDTAVIFLDVVMEHNNTGLELVNYIRKELKNRSIRIILRTGQPGEAPEAQVIAEYDINDYRLKTELTVQRLYTSMYEALRSYRDIIILEHHSVGLQKIIKISASLFYQESLKDFFNTILGQLMYFKNEDASIYFREKPAESGLAFLDDHTIGTVIAATGHFKEYLGMPVKEVLEIHDIYEKALELKNQSQDHIIQIKGGYLICKNSFHGIKSFIFIESPELNFDIELVKVFLSNYSLSLDNYLMNQQLIQTQKEIISTLGDTIEKRSHEAANHVLRVSRISRLIGKKLSLTPDYLNMLELASTMHDAGKIGIPDAILLKPGALTSEEFELMKTHSQIGYHLFAKSQLDILKLAAEICLTHHERYDGTGYPHQLKGEEIPLPGRIVALADVFDALSHKRSYKDAWPTEAVVEYIKQNSGTQFDPSLVLLFLQNTQEIIAILKELPE